MNIGRIFSIREGKICFFKNTHRGEGTEGAPLLGWCQRIPVRAGDFRAQRHGNPHDSAFMVKSLLNISMMGSMWDEGG